MAGDEECCGAGRSFVIENMTLPENLNLPQHLSMCRSAASCRADLPLCRGPTLDEIDLARLLLAL